MGPEMAPKISINHTVGAKDPFTMWNVYSSDLLPDGPSKWSSDSSSLLFFMYRKGEGMNLGELTHKRLKLMMELARVNSEIEKEKKKLINDLTYYDFTKQKNRA